MKNAFEVNKTAKGFELTIKTGRGAFAAALVNGKLTLEMSKETADAVSKALYTPKKKSFRKGPAPLKRAEEIYDNETPIKEKTHREAPSITPTPPSSRKLVEGKAPAKPASYKR